MNKEVSKYLCAPGGVPALPEQKGRPDVNGYRKHRHME